MDRFANDDGRRVPEKPNRHFDPMLTPTFDPRRIQLHTSQLLLNRPIHEEF
jgi:hypothetical protein